MKQQMTVPAWDDLRAPSSAINPAGSAAAATVDTEDGSLIFSNGQVQTVAISFQMPHAWKVGTDVSFHIHWCKTTSAAGTVKWQVKYKWTNIGDVIPAFSAFADGTEAIPNSDTANKHAIFEFTDFAGTGKTISSQLTVVLQRLSSGGGADTYAAPVKLLEADLHYQIDSFGSKEEYVK